MIAIDPDTSEIVRTRGEIQNVTGLDSILQHVRIRCRLLRGEVFLDQSKGLRYVGLILEKGTPPSRIEGEFAETIAGTPGVTLVSDVAIDIDRETRHGTVDASGAVSVEDEAERMPFHEKFTIEPPV